jgi:type VI secretion system protein ImpK
MTAATSVSSAAGRRGTLAVLLQEVLTAVVRLRANRQATNDAAAFRAHVKQLLSTAHEDARRAGYESGDVKLAVYAVVVFLDESVLSSQHPAFSGWPLKPLQEEIFGGHTGGEQFFENVRRLLARQDSDDLGDVLEVHQLCLLLGYQGRYGGTRDELRRWMTAIAEKMGRIRGGPQPLSPEGGPPQHEKIPVPVDPWMRRLRYAALGGLALAVLLFLVFRLWLLPSWVSDLRAVQVP